MKPDLPKSVMLHATCLDIGGRGVLIQGRPGAGKSDLAIRLIDQPGSGIAGGLPKTARLVADDQVVIRRLAAGLVASPPENLRGLIEIRGLGILKIPYCPETILRLIVTLRKNEEIDRMPQPTDLMVKILGVGLPRISLDPRSASAPARLRAALDALSVDERNVISTTPY
jgi:serine kinase of HPr protein (carbohydrate metabolism regulator)